MVQDKTWNFKYLIDILMPCFALGSHFTVNLALRMVKAAPKWSKQLTLTMKRQWICLSFYLSTSLSFYLSFYRSTLLSLYLLMCHLSIFLSFYLPIFLSFYRSIFLSLYLSIFLSFYLSIFLCSFLSFYLSVFLSFYFCIFLPFYLSTYLSNGPFHKVMDHSIQYHVRNTLILNRYLHNTL